MDNELDTIGKRLKYARTKLGFSQTELAQMVDLSMRGYQANERDISNPSIAVLRKFSDLGVSPLWLLNGSGKMELDRKSKEIYKNSELTEESTANVVKSFSLIFDRLLVPGLPEAKLDRIHDLYDTIGVQNTKAFFEFISEISDPLESFVLIQVLNPQDESLFQISDSNLYRYHPLRRSWVKNNNLNPEKLKAIFPSDDSMRPTLVQGDVLIIDERGVNDLTGLFAIESRGRVIVRRLDFGVSGVSISTDNEQYPNELLSDEEAKKIKKIGKVIRIESYR